MRKPANRTAVLAASISAIAGGSLILSTGMGAYRHYLLTAALIVCGALVYIAISFKKIRDRPTGAHRK